MALLSLKFRDWFEARYWEGKAQTPNYSFDRFVQDAEKLKGNVDSMVGNAKEKEAELDRSKKKNKEEPSSAEEEYDEPNEKETDKAWKQLRKIHKEKAPDFKKRLEDAEKSSGS